MKRVTAALLSAAVLGVALPPLTARAADDGKPNARANIAPRRALDRPLPEVRFNAVALSDALDFLADASGANMTIDWKALDEAKVAKDTPITLRMSSKVPLRKVLKLVLQQAGGAGALTFYVDDGVVEVTSQEASDKVLISRTYPIQDLLFQAPDYNDAPQLDLQSATQGQSAGGGGGGGGGSSSQSLFQNNTSNTADANGKATQADRADEIIKLITTTVKPELWQANGGTATISFFRGMLVVNAPRSIHELLESHQ